MIKSYRYHTLTLCCYVSLDITIPLQTHSHTTQQMPADVRLIKTTDMTVDNSNLTGENDPQKRAVSADHAAVLEAENLAFMGTIVINGKGVGIVIRRGDASILGKISSLASAPKHHELSPLAQEIRSFVILIALAAFVIALILFAASLAIGNSFTIALSLFIGIFVACTPQGLPATVTMLLASAAKELSKHNVLVKNLHAVDTLGAITLLCSDKTGTLTMNRMVSAINLHLHYLCYVCSKLWV
jgi:sodium/potassium-transporting ATPase subunit alpha